MVNVAIEEAVVALAFLFASFYIWNFHYPAGAAVTLEFFQR